MNFTIFFSFLNFLDLHSEILQNNQKVLTLIQQAHIEKNYETIVVAGNTFQGFNSLLSKLELLKQLQGLYLPQLQLDNDVENKIAIKFNKKLLVLYYMSEEELKTETELQTLWQKLENITQTHTVLMFERHVNETFIESTLSYCVEHKAMYTIALIIDGLQQNVFYTIKMFPKLEIIRKKLDEFILKIFPEHVTDLQGYPLRAICSDVKPRCYYYNNTNGKLQMSGIYGLFVSNYAKKHNATLIFPTSKMKAIFLDEIDKCIQNGSHDLAAEYSALLEKPNISYTNLIDSHGWCLIVPVEKPIPSYIFYFVIYDIPTIILLLLTYVLIAAILKIIKQETFDFELDINTFNGLLGQSFRMEQNFMGLRSFVYLIICFVGLNFNAIYNSYISSFESSPPTEPPLTSIDQLRTRGLSFLLFKDLVGFINQHKIFELTNMPLTFIKSYEEFNKVRDSYDTRYVFLAADSGYSHYEEQQKFFSKPILRFSNICWVSKVVLPLQLNSLYSPSMNTFIGQVRQSGLLTYWKRLSFLELVRLKQIQLMDLSKRNIFEPLKVEDLYLVFIVLFIAWCLTILCFIAEIYFYRRLYFEEH